MFQLANVRMCKDRRINSITVWLLREWKNQCSSLKETDKINQTKPYHSIRHLGHVAEQHHRGRETDGEAGRGDLNIKIVGALSLNMALTIRLALLCCLCLSLSQCLRETAREEDGWRSGKGRPKIMKYLLKNTASMKILWIRESIFFINSCGVCRSYRQTWYIFVDSYDLGLEEKLWITVPRASSSPSRAAGGRPEISIDGYGRE